MASVALFFGDCQYLREESGTGVVVLLGHIWDAFFPRIWVLIEASMPNSLSDWQVNNYSGYCQRSEWGLKLVYNTSA